ncbi:DUF7684 family protein [Xanthomonas sacchari]
MDAEPLYIHIKPGSAPPALPHEPTRTIVVLDQLVAPDWQHLVSRWLIKTGCLYMLAWGDGCSSWDDSVDMANAELFGQGGIPDESSAMTTWHADESLMECMWFAKNCAMHAVVELERTVLLHVGPAAREQDLLDAYAEA